MLCRRQSVSRPMHMLLLSLFRVCFGHSRCSCTAFHPAVQEQLQRVTITMGFGDIVVG